MGPWDCFGRHVGPRAFPNPRYSTLEKPRGPSAITSLISALCLRSPAHLPSELEP